MNVATYEALRSQFDVHYVGPVNPPIFYPQKIRSKLWRLTGFQGDFFFFSERRLRVIAREVNARRRPDAVMDFFHGFTSWPLSRIERPYIASSDCTFHDYIEIFHRRDLFTGRDLARIEAAEADWLKRASMVLLRSRWAADRAVRHYGLDPMKVDTVRSCGEIDMPPDDRFDGARRFVFVSTNFRAKGGDVVLAAFRDVRRRHPDASLTIVGDRPADLASHDGVVAAGFLRKEDPEEVARFRDILAGAMALVLPTRGDVSPLIIAEAGYFGCPAIASRRFAIPELVLDGATGILLDDPRDAGAVARAMTWMIEHEHEYRRMRIGAWDRSRSEYSRPQFEKRVVDFVNQVMQTTTRLKG